MYTFMYTSLFLNLLAGILLCIMFRDKSEIYASKSSKKVNWDIVIGICVGAMYLYFTLSLLLPVFLAHFLLFIKTFF